MYTDDSSYYETTYSQDERIEKSLQAKKAKRKRRAAQEDLNRQQTFEDYLKSDLPLLKLAGLKFHTFRHLKIKFSFQPSKVANFVNKKIIFYVSLRYRDRYWSVKRDTLPANYKKIIYKEFYKDDLCAGRDENILKTLGKIYDILVDWTHEEQRFRLGKLERYKRGEDIVLDSDDQEIFLNDEERRIIRDKRDKILQRMVPPEPKRPTRRRRKHIA